MIPTHFFQDLGGLPATLAKPPLFADLGLVLGIPTEGFLPVPVRSLPRPAIRNGPGEVRLGRIWLLNGAVGTRPLIVQELFSRMVGQALPHEGVDSSRCYPAAWQRALVSLFVQRCKCTKPPHRGRGPRPIPAGLHLAPVVAELGFFALGSYSRGGRMGWAAAHLGFYVLGPSPGAPLLV